MRKNLSQSEKQCDNLLCSTKTLQNYSFLERPRASLFSLAVGSVRQAFLTKK